MDELHEMQWSVVRHENAREPKGKGKQNSGVDQMSQKKNRETSQMVWTCYREGG